MTSKEILIGNDRTKFYQTLKQTLDLAKKKEWNNNVIKGVLPAEGMAKTDPQMKSFLLPIDADALSEMIDEIEWEKFEEEKMLELMKKVLEPFFRLLEEQEQNSKQ